MKKRTIIMLGIMILCIISLVKPVNATENYYTQTAGGTESSNVSENNYTSASTVVDSYLQVNTDGTISRIEHIDNTIVVETYSSAFELKTKKTLEIELTYFGGFYSGENYNFLVFGDTNINEDDSAEVMRIVKYSKKWERIGSVSLKGCNTTEMFSGGSCKMTETGGILFITTAHTMYKSDDGYRHQSNMLVKVDQENMEVTYCRSGVTNIYWNGYVSHSFNQFILTDNNYIYTIDHGDGYPRGMSICKTEPDAEKPTSVAIPFEILGDFNSTITGASIGGTELSTNNCLIVGNSIPQEEVFNNSAARNIFLTLTPKDNLTTANSTVKWITNYEEDSGIVANTPQLIKINDNKFLIMWEERTNREYGKIKMILVDGDGNTLTNTITIGGRLSECQPIIYNDKVTWYITSNDRTPVFFALDVSTTEKFNQYNNINIVDYNDFSHYTYYCSSNGDIKLYKNDDSIENVTIPGTKYPWAKVTLAEGLFKNCTNVKTVTIPNGFEEITNNMFYGCTSLTTVNIPNTVKTIGEKAFLGSGITQITMPDSITTVGESAFRNCANLTKAILSNKLTELSKYMFYNSNKLQDIEIPSSVVTIGDSSLAWTGITQITIPSSVKTIEPYAFFYCENLKGTITIPETVTTVGDSICEYSYGVDKLLIKNANATTGTRLLIHSISIEKGKTIKVLEGAKVVSSKSNNESIAKVTSEGEITAIAEGMTSISYYNEAGELVGATNLTVTKQNPEIPFIDVSIDSWYYNAVKYNYKNGMVLGTTDTTFEPNKKLTRGMLVTILHRMEGYPKQEGTSKYPDVQNSDAYYYTAVKWATANKIVNGYDSGNFGPNNPVTREQLAVILNQYCRYKGKYKVNDGDLSNFPDGSKVSDFAKGGMKWAVGTGVITGSNGYLKPQGTTTRAEAVSMLYKYCEKIK